MAKHSAEWLVFDDLMKIAPDCTPFGEVAGFPAHLTLPVPKVANCPWAERSGI